MLIVPVDITKLQGFKNWGFICTHRDIYIYIYYIHFTHVYLHMMCCRGVPLLHANSTVLISHFDVCELPSLGGKQWKELNFEHCFPLLHSQSVKLVRQVESMNS